MGVEGEGPEGGDECVGLDPEGEGPMWGVVREEKTV